MQAHLRFQNACLLLLRITITKQAVQHLLLRIIFQDAQSSLKSPQLHLQATQLADQEITACLSGRSALAEKHAEIYGFPEFAK